ncbi:hypothetical protein CORC01_02892 [Colletotrichum orchidophilum]|uniref:Uncharacterized protein n=1 Tax=Colletotrichum orchidophilum TaxID=1209926 RepID=A0A1G4BJU2_9PEZI|nr:uncharacterized protein CORC01_02892 [Colletotrichum orchidophilum]OHF01701.1 hypothetical protein CORC01_02892 [Colletotrichum orchidophilum]
MEEHLYPFTIGAVPSWESGYFKGRSGVRCGPSHALSLSLMRPGVGHLGIKSTISTAGRRWLKTMKSTTRLGLLRYMLHPCRADTKSSNGSSSRALTWRILGDISADASLLFVAQSPHLRKTTTGQL